MVMFAKRSPSLGGKPLANFSLEKNIIVLKKIINGHVLLILTKTDVLVVVKTDVLAWLPKCDNFF